jgi:hypothetical protein
LALRVSRQGGINYGFVADGEDEHDGRSRRQAYDRPKTIPTEAFAVLATYGFAAVKDQCDRISFVPRDRAEEGISKGWFTAVKPPE